MKRANPNHRVELKYCEGCGCLLTRPIGSGVTLCAICEKTQSEEEIYLTLPKRTSQRCPRLPKKVDLHACADERVYTALEVCA